MSIKSRIVKFATKLGTNKIKLLKKLNCVF